MSFNGNGQKFAGDDGYLQIGEYSTEIIGDASTPLPAGFYMIIAVAGPSAFPAPAEGGTAAAAGDFLTVTSADSITPAVGDDVVTIVLTDQCDISSWAMEFTKDEIEATTLCDSVKIYLAGKADMSGTLNGVFVLGTSDAIDGSLQEFISIAKQDGDASFDRFDQHSTILLGKFYINKDTAKADELYIVANYQLYGYGLGGEIGSAQSFSSSFRFASNSYTSAADVTIIPQPTFYRLGDGS